MYERLNGVVLRTISYNDKNSIVRVYTDSHGLLSFLLPQSNGKTARMRRALFQPLSLVEIEADIAANREIYRIREARCLVPLPSLHSHPVKNAVSLFITELLSHVIVEEEPNAPLFAYISSSVQLLDRLEKGIANFHICFLYNLGIFLGIEPDTSTYTRGSRFDMLNGVFTTGIPSHSHFLHPEESEALMTLSRMSFANMHLFRFNRDQRRRLLDLIIGYYRLHNSAVGEIRSLDILTALFA